MNAVYRFLATYEGLIYIILALAGLFSFRWLWKSWREWRDSVFGLEREFAMRRLSQSLLISLLIIFLFFGELFLASFIVPELSAPDVMPTATLDILNQTSGAIVGNSVAVSTAVAPISNSALDTSAGCIPGKFILTSPEPGQEVSGIVKLVGTVDIDNFGFYKYEVSPQGAGAWATISGSRKAVRDGDLGLWDTSSWTPGDYEMRLEVTDNQGQAFPPCIVSIRVRAP